MIYHVTYTDASGTPLLEATFNAAGPREALEHMLTVPSLACPPGTASIHVEVEEVS